MANEIQNNNNTEVDEDNINIDDIEGLERDLPDDDNQTNKANLNGNESLELLPDGKLKTATTNADGSKEEIKEDQSDETQKKNKKFKIILLILIVLITIIAGLLYFSLSSEKTEETPQPVQTTTKELPPIETYEFKLDHINVSRLNKKLENLNKYELLGMTEEEYLLEEKKKALLKAQEEALQEKVRLEQEALEKEALEKARLEEELALKAKEVAKTESPKAATSQTETDTTAATSQTTNANNEQKIDNNVPAVVDNSANEFLKFILINTNEKAIYKSYLQKIKSVDTRINPCRNLNNTIEIFVGPLMPEDNPNTIIEGIKNVKLSQDVIFVEVTKDEFAKRCMVSE